MNHSHTIENRKKLWDDFMSSNSSTKNVFVINYSEGMPVRPLLWPDKKKERIDWILQLYHWQMEQMEWLVDDKLPFLENLTGTEIFAEAFGCKVHRPIDNSPFALPLIHDASEVSKLKVPELSSSSLSVLFDIADEVQRRAGKNVLMRMPDIQSPMDIAALIWDKSELLMAMVDEPEAVKELSWKVNQLLKAFLDEWFSRYGKSFIAHFPIYYMKEGITLSEDEIGIVNTEMFDEFFLPELCELSDRYCGIGIHCCANSRHQWDGFKKIPNLRLINLSFNEKHKLAEALKIFENKSAQWHLYYNGGEDEITYGSLRPENARIVIDKNVNSKDEAMRLSEKLWKDCGR